MSCTSMGAVMAVRRIQAGNINAIIDKVTY